MRVLVAWADPESPNMGVRVLARGLADALPDDWDLHFVSHAAPMQSGPLLARRSLAAMVLPTAMRQELSSYDLMVDVGEGDSFASIYGVRRLMRLTALKCAAGAVQLPVVMAPQTLGPWETSPSRVLARLGIGASDQVWARDSQSFARARHLAGDKLGLATDLVFAVSTPVEATATGSVEGPVAVNVSGLLWRPNRHVDHGAYQQLVRSLLDELGRRAVPVRIIAHVVAPGQHDDDSACSQEIAAEYANAEAVLPSDLDQLRAAIAEARLMIGARMHACLNALSLGVPTVPLAYSDKFQALFADLGYPPGFDLRTIGASPVEGEELLVRAPTAEQTERARAAGIARAALFIERLRRGRG